MADNARGIHVSPGIYTREIDINYAVRSLGITSLGLVGETLKGPAFQPMSVSNWREFQDLFGGTSTEKYKGSQYPKYELPYIAKSYLTESERLNVVRVLGLSGYNAGPAWIITASHGENGKKQAVAVLRSRGTYKPYKASNSGNTCVCEGNAYDTLSYYVGEQTTTFTGGCEEQKWNMDALKLEPYYPLSSTGNECKGYQYGSGDTDSGSTFVDSISALNRGRFKIVGVSGETSGGTTPDNAKEGRFEYVVSLNPSDKEYILNVLGTKAYDGDAPIYVESLYDVALEQGIANLELTQIDEALGKYEPFKTADYCALEPVSSIMTIPHTALTRKHVGLRFLADQAAQEAKIECVPYDYQKGTPMTIQDVKNYNSGSSETDFGDIDCVNLDSKNDKEIAKCYVTPGQIYTVRQYTTQNGKREYYYAWYAPKTVYESVDNDDIDTTVAANLYGLLKNAPCDEYYSGISEDAKGVINSGNVCTLVLNNADGLYYRWDENKDDGDVHFVALDLNDYKSQYRYASTPWIVSNLKGDTTKMELNKLFRFHTISDGDASNYEVKVSVENIRPDEGVFDVVVRNVYDSDESIVALERFSRCTMTPGDSNYIAYQIGSFDGVYESKSKYITVEVADNTAAQLSVPAGFLGYPIPNYSGLPIGDNTKYEDVNENITFPTIKYNTTYDEDIKNRRQYFGLSSWVGVDIDTFTFKGNKAYIEDPRFLSHGFHLDSRLVLADSGASGTSWAEGQSAMALTVDGESDYKFDYVSPDARTRVYDQPPIIGTEDEMYGSIYENVNLRKFTVFFYGGFDGWDVYRDERTNTDEYKMTQYKGYINLNSGEGYAFNKIADPESIGLDQAGITSDWYAYLAGIRQFANPEAVDINVFATPGIDYVNQKSLVEETIDMVEQERADSIYVITTPDKPSGAGDMVDEMYTPEDAVSNIEDSEIDSNYSCTYYPWVKYLDSDNNQYIYLPATKDVVRNFAETDNNAYPWFAPAGVSRGNVDCVRAKYITKLADEDTLYEGRINPIKTFAQDGPKVWGQKNLQINESTLNRINVRRLMLRLRKLIVISCIGLIFDPNDSTAKQSFISTVTPILDNIKNNRGISDYRIEVNDTAESRMRHELPARIWVKPVTSLEYITIDFMITPEGFNWENQ